MTTQQLLVHGLNTNVFIAGNGPPILFVHGFPLDHSMWREQLARFSDNYQVIAPDLPGFGTSELSSPNGIPDTLTMADFADHLAALILHLGLSTPPVFCGLSMGGYIAWEFFKRHRSLLKALILCDTRAAPDTSEAAASRHKAAADVLARGPEVLATAMIPRLVSEQTRSTHPELVTELRRTMLATRSDSIAAALRGMAQREDATPLLPRIDLPTLLIVGESDVISPVAEMQSMAAAIPGAKIEVIAGAGHMAPLEAPEPVNSAIDTFLSSLR